MPTANVVRVADEYCLRLQRALREAPPAERDDIVEELRSHILERAEACATQGEVTDDVLTGILRAVGDPQQLASEYRTQSILNRASRSRSPWLLLCATLRWARTGVVGLSAFLATAVGYGSAAVFLLCAWLKAFLPSRIGLWLAPQHTLSFGYWNGLLSGTEIYGISVRPPFSFVLGTLGTTEGPVRELLGVWLIPVGILCGVLSFGATTLLAGWLIRKYGRWGSLRLYAPGRVGMGPR